MPGGAGAKVVPALHPFDDFKLDLASIRLPEPAAKTLTAAVAPTQTGGH
jgi:hypothetical protein